MTDDGLEPVEVTGRWVGFYRTAGNSWDVLDRRRILNVDCEP